MAYVPPALRRKQEAAQQGKKEESHEFVRHQSSNASAKDVSRSLKDIQKHFWPTWVPETPVFVRNSQIGSTDAGDSDRRSIEHGNAIPGGSNTSTNQEDVNKNLQATQPDRGDSVEANLKSDIRPDASPEAQQIASRELERFDKGSASSVEQLKDSQPEETAASDKKTLSLDIGHDDREKNRQAAHSADLPVIESIHPHNTLNSTEQSPDSLQYVLLFYDANPRWQGDHIIYVKSAIELLPTVKADDKTQTSNSSAEPLAKNVMVFEQQNGHRTPTSAMFKFIGYFNLTKMQVLEPQTPELVRMQEQKWTRKDKYGRSKPINRNAESWKKSLSQRWAVLGFEKDGKAAEELRPPQIKSTQRGTHDGSQKEGRSVNEMLREMRLREGS